MKTQRIGVVLLPFLLFLLNTWATDQQEPTDEQEALQITLTRSKVDTPPKRLRAGRIDSNPNR